MLPASILITLLTSVAASALSQKAQSSSVSLQPRDVSEVTDAIREKAAVNPQLQQVAETWHQAVTPVPWYHSPVFIGSAVAFGASILGVVWGIEVSQDTQQAIVNVIPSVVTGLGALASIVSRLMTKLQPLSLTQK